jgi:endoribonuclease LACTB2
MNVPRFAKLSPLVHVVLGLNPGNYTLQGTNTYLVGSGRSKILIDTGEGVPEYKDLLRSSLIDAECDEISLILITHHHKGIYH